MKYVELTVKVPVADTEHGDRVQEALEKGAGTLVSWLGLSANYWTIRTADPSDTIQVAEVVR